MDGQYERVARQFGPSAAAYAVSSTHADAVALTDLVDRLQLANTDRCIDIATGAGNMALAMAPHVATVVAVDITPEMLILTRERATKSNLGNLSVALGAAERLPFADSTFSVATVRTASHHFADVGLSVREMARVLRPGGLAMIVDTAVPEDAEIDSALNLIEVIRDPSHVRNYAPSEWRGFLAAASFEVHFERMHSHALGKRMRFSDWTERMKVPPPSIERLRGLFEEASPGLKSVMDIQVEGDDYWFTLPEITLVARRIGEP